MEKSPVFSNHDLMLAAMRGEKTSCVPWAPRMDLWSIAQKTRASLPGEFKDLNTVEIAEALGVGCHAVRGDVTLLRKPGSLALRGLGFDNHPDYPYTVTPGNLLVNYEMKDDVHSTLIKTSHGDVSFQFKQTAEMRTAGISLPFILKYPVQTVHDLDAVAEVFEDLRITPTPDAYARFHHRVGDSGVAVASGCIAASPMHLLLHELVAMDTFFYLYHDAPGEMRKFCSRLEPFFESLLDASLACKAEAVFWGANFDRDLTWPPFFESEIRPWLKRVSQKLHSAGKLLICHTDGENSGLLELYRGCGFDVGESVCPSPMTSLALSEVRKGMGDGICVWGGV
ncbi:MAG: hypothetical protein HN368_08015, partial [Spirochaetales bacterium]|nr:hypothetical protein [Spirochaetales bacterium]